MTTPAAPATAPVLPAGIGSAAARRHRRWAIVRWVSPPLLLLLLTLWQLGKSAPDFAKWVDLRYGDVLQPTLISAN